MTGRGRSRSTCPGNSSERPDQAALGTSSMVPDDSCSSQEERRECHDQPMKAWEASSLCLWDLASILWEQESSSDCSGTPKDMVSFEVPAGIDPEIAELVEQQLRAAGINPDPEDSGGAR